MKIFIIILLFPIALFSQKKYELNCNPNILETSRLMLLQEVGTKEKSGRNDGKQIEKYLRSVGIKRPAPYCQAGQYWCFAEACNMLEFDNDSIPIQKSGLAISSVRYAKKNGNRTKYKPAIDDLIVWKKSRNWQGHVERIIYVGQKGWVLTVGFNTSNGKRGSQREGNGVYIRKRNILSGIGSLKIYGLVGFK